MRSKKIIKRLGTFVVVTAMILSLCISAFAEQTTVTNPSFIKESGSSLALGMGTGVISDAYMEGDSLIVELQPYSRWLLLTYTGEITEAYYLDSSGNKVDETNLVDDSVMELDPSRVVETPTSGVYGIYLKLTFSMSPSTPPGMSETMNAYFTCDEWNS